MKQRGIAGLMILGWLGLMGCSGLIGAMGDSPPIPLSSEPSSVPAPPAANPAPQPPPKPQTDYFREAVNRATSAVVIGQSAQSQGDWQLAVGRWQQAVELMGQVSPDSPNYAQAQAKIVEYQQNLATAQQRATSQPMTADPAPAPLQEAMPQGLVAQIPIQERRGGTPVVAVTFQGQGGRHSFPMLFDTGASGTLITAEMAEQIGVTVVGRTQVKIADGSRVELPIGYVELIEVGGLRKTAMLVTIGGSVGLLGQDVFGEFGIAMGSHLINLHQ